MIRRKGILPKTNKSPLKVGLAPKGPNHHCSDRKCYCSSRECSCICLIPFNIHRKKTFTGPSNHPTPEQNVHIIPKPDFFLGHFGVGSPLLFSPPFEGGKYPTGTFSPSHWPLRDLKRCNCYSEDIPPSLKSIGCHWWLVGSGPNPFLKHMRTVIPWVGTSSPSTGEKNTYLSCHHLVEVHEQLSHATGIDLHVEFFL